jgi:hypothetical protein
VDDEMNVLGAGGCDQGKEVGFRPVKKVAFVIKRVGPYDHRAFAFCRPEFTGDGLHYHSKQVCRFNGGVARTINEPLKKHGLEHSPPGILTCGECEQESSLAKKNE